jgi:hypothetical protein
MSVLEQIEMNNMKKAVVGIFVMIFVHTSSAYSASNHLNELSNGVIVKDVPTQKKLTEKDLTILGFAVGTSTLADVAKLMPNKNLVRSGDAGTSNSSLCYTNGKDIILTFNSSEMGGGDKTITEIFLYSDLKKSQDKAICIQSDKINSDIEIYGLKLGLGRNKVVALKGKPSKENKELIIYNYESSIRIGENKFDVTSLVELFFSNGTLNRIELSHIESN